MTALLIIVVLIALGTVAIGTDPAFRAEGQSSRNSESKAPKKVQAAQETQSVLITNTNVIPFARDFIKNEFADAEAGYSQKRAGSGSDYLMHEGA